MVVLENDDLLIKSKVKGAELTSIYSKKNKLEYLWKGDTIFWPRQSPVLFPIVGKLNKDSYHWKNKIYHLTQHGFARDRDFLCIEKTSSMIRYQLKSDKNSLAIFPFSFELEISYMLCQNTIQINYQVLNLDEEDMYFSLGAHPGFNCLLESTDSFEDYYIEFEKEESLERYLLANGLLTGEKEKVFIENKILPLTYSLFEKDALVFKNLASQKVYLKSKKHSHGVGVDFTHFPYLGIWTKPQAPFICIEPWYGVADLINFEYDLKQKEGIQKLTRNSSFSTNFIIEIF